MCSNVNVEKDEFTIIKDMNWEPFSLHFKQIFDGGYRYLDKCGEFILSLENNGLMTAEVNVTGAKLAFPEYGVSVVADTHQIAITQESCGADHKPFVDVCNLVSKTYQEFFTPSGIVSVGFASKSFLRFASLEAAWKHGLKLGDKYQDVLSKTVEMVPSQKRLDYNFTSGSQNLHVVAQPITFTSITKQQYNVGARISDSQKKRIERLNKSAERVDSSLAHAVMLELDLIENNPPADSLSKHFSVISKMEKNIQAELAKAS